MSQTVQELRARSEGFAVLALEPGREAAALLGAAAERNGLQRLKVRQAGGGGSVWGGEAGKWELRMRWIPRKTSRFLCSWTL